MRESPLRRATPQHWEGIVNVSLGPLANGEGWYDTMDACNSTELMDLAFADKLEI
jgi:hypothetical protein